VTEDLSKQLNEYWNGIGVILGGSVSYGEVDEFSDLDLFVIAPEKIDVLPIVAQFNNKDIRVEGGYTWSQLEEFIRIIPADAENRFYGIQKAIILHDYNNKYLKIQEKIGEYLPGSIWKERILHKWFSVFYCSRNGVRKALTRSDVIAAGIWKGKLVEAVLELTFLLNRQYIPPTKWLYKKFGELPILSKEIDPHIKIILEVDGAEEMEIEGKFIWKTYNTYIKENDILSAEMADKPWQFV
jgi:predicted nucleotidyltransferase